MNGKKKAKHQKETMVQARVERASHLHPIPRPIARQVWTALLKLDLLPSPDHLIESTKFHHDLEYACTLLTYCTFSFKSVVTSHAPPVNHELWSRSPITWASVEPPTGHIGLNCLKKQKQKKNGKKTTSSVQNARNFCSRSH
jgi:hypothetical protein